MTRRDLDRERLGVLVLVLDLFVVVIVVIVVIVGQTGAVVDLDTAVGTAHHGAAITAAVPLEPHQECKDFLLELGQSQDLASLTGIQPSSLPSAWSFRMSATLLNTVQ